MLTFAKFIDSNPSCQSDVQQQRVPHELYAAYIDWFLNNSGKPVSQDSAEIHPEISPESLFLHLLIQLKIIEEYCKDSNNSILAEDHQTIVEYKNAIQPIIYNWLKNMDQAAHTYVLSAMNADLAKRKYMGLALCALIFTVSATLTVLAGINIIPPGFVVMFMPAIISFFAGFLVGMSYDPKTEVDTLHPALVEGFMYKQVIPSTEVYHRHATQDIYVAPHPAYFDGDAAEFSLKHQAVVAYTKTEDCKGKIKDFVDNISTKINPTQFGNRTVVEDLSTQVMTQRYSRKYSTFTTNVDEYEKQRIKPEYRVNPVLDLRN